MSETIVIPFWRPGMIVELKGEKSEMKRMVNDIIQPAMGPDEFRDRFHAKSDEYDVEVDIWNEVEIER